MRSCRMMIIGFGFVNFSVPVVVSVLILTFARLFLFLITKVVPTPTCADNGNDILSLKSGQTDLRTSGKDGNCNRKRMFVTDKIFKMKNII